MAGRDFAVMVRESWARAVAEAAADIDAFRGDLLEALAAPDPDVRSAAVAALFEADDEEAHDSVLAMLDDPSPRVRHQVAEYLTEYAVETDAQRLVSALAAYADLSFLLSMALMQATGRPEGIVADDEDAGVREREIASWRAYLVRRGLPGAG